MSLKRIFGNKFILILIAITIIPISYAISTQYEEEILSIKLLAITPTQIEVPDTTIYVKTTGIAQKGSLQNIKQSQMLAKHPTTSWGQLSLVDLEGVKDPIDTFKLSIRGKFQNAIPTSTSQWVVDSSQLTIEVLSQNKKLEKISTY